MDSLSTLYQQDVTAGLLRSDPAQVAALPHLDRVRGDLLNASTGRRGVLARLRKPEAVKGLYLWGGVGRGKSMLMDFFFTHVGIVQKRRVHFHAFMQEVHGALHAARQNGHNDPLAPVATGLVRDLRLLCLDEMEITDIADAMIVGRLFKALFEAGVVVVTTSNRVPDSLYENGLNRGLFLPFVALIKSHMAVHHIDGPTDHRRARLKGEARYFVPPDAAAKAAIDAIWLDMTHGAAAPLEFELHGRTLRLPLFHNGMARAGFWDLCAQPLGPGDYLEIARRLRVLILEDIPLLHRENYNEARRFVTLVDALYEDGVQLIASAQAQPEGLYVEGEGVFEFERTASRLIQMQGADWGADQGTSRGAS